MIKLINTPFILLIRFYQNVLSPGMPSVCRYQPTCSQYGLEAFQKHNLFYALYLTTKRVLSCHPWGGSGYDPIP